MKAALIIKNTKAKIQPFLSNINWKNFLIFMGFLILAFIFWLMLFFRRDVEGSYQIPLKYSNIPHDVVFDNPLPEYIEVRLADKGSEIFRYDLFLKRDTLKIDVKKYKKEGVGAIQGNQFLQLIRERISPGTQLRGYTPASISLATSKLHNKELKVVFDGEITTSRSNLVADSASMIPKTIMAYGAESRLKEIKNALTEYTVFNNLKSTSQLTLKIKPIDGIKFVPNEVDIYIPINEYTERSFEVPIRARNVPENMDVKFFPSQVDVSFSVILEDYKKIAPEDLEIVLNYNEFRDNENGRVDLHTSKSPSTIKNIRVSPASVEFLLEKKHR